MGIYREEEQKKDLHHAKGNRSQETEDRSQHGKQRKDFTGWTGYKGYQKKDNLIRS